MLPKKQALKIIFKGIFYLVPSYLTTALLPICTDPSICLFYIELIIEVDNK